jgi:ApaG protein
MKNDIRVYPESFYLAEQSDPDNNQFVFAYVIRIENCGEQPVQLLHRHWVITDANNGVSEVKGVGVVGEQPTIAPGETYQYSSGSDLPTDVGTMKGSYRMKAADGVEFDAKVPEFVLTVPRVLH